MIHMNSELQIKSENMVIGGRMMAKETDYKAVAQQIIEVVGGPENIISVAHCATRLRLIVKKQGNH